MTTYPLKVLRRARGIQALDQDNGKDKIHPYFNRLTNPTAGGTNVPVSHAVASQSSAKIQSVTVSTFLTF